MQYDRGQYQEGYRAGYGDYQIKHNGDIEKAHKQTAKYILQKWYDENKAKGDEQDLVLELAAENGVELEEEV